MNGEYNSRIIGFIIVADAEDAEAPADSDSYAILADDAPPFFLEDDLQ